MKLLALALLLAAPLAAQTPYWTMPTRERCLLRWGDVIMNCDMVAPIAIGNELGLAIYNTSGLSFAFMNGTTRRLRVHAIAWNAVGSAELWGQQQSCNPNHSSRPIPPVSMNGFGGIYTSFEVGQVTGSNCWAPGLTLWHFHAWNGFNYSDPVPHAMVVTAVGGW